MTRIQIQTRKRSWAERHPIRSAMLYTSLTIGFIIFLATGGVAIVTQLASFLENTKPTDSSSSQNDALLPVPYINPLSSDINTKTITISGNTLEGSTIRINVNGTVSDYLVNTNGNFSAEVTLREGDNIIKALTADNRGNTSKESSTYSVIVDTEPPTITIDSPKENDSFSGKKEQTVAINGTTEGAVQLTVNDRIIIVSSTGAFSYNYNLSEGDNVLKFVAKDRAGNETESSITVHFSP